MASLILNLAIETDMVRDCIADLGRVHEALTKRHGPVFRDLEKRIEAVMVDEAQGFGFPEIEPGRMVMTPPKEWVGMVSEAKILGVI